MTPRDTAGAQLHQHWSPDTPPAPQPARAAAPGAVQDASCAWPRNLQHPQPQAGHRALQVARWEEEEGEEAPTDTLGQQPGSSLPFHTQSKPHLFNCDEVFQAALVSTCCERLRRHRSFIPSAHASSAATAGGAGGGPQDLCHLTGSWHGDTDTNLLSLMLLQPGRVRPAVSAPCRDLTCSSPPLPKQGRIRLRGSCQRHFPLPPPPAQLQRGAVGGGNEAAKSIERGTEPGHK